MAGVAAPAAARTIGPFSLRWSHVRTLLWLRWTLTWRGYTRSASAVVGLVFGMFFMLVLAVLLGAGTALGYLALARQLAAQLLFIVLAGLYVFWAVFPLLRYTLNEGLDVTKLQIYPVTRAEQMAGLVLSTLLDVATLGLLALFIAIIIGWHASPLAVVITVLALAVAYVHIIGFSQVVLAALMGMLRSRRYRDLAVIVAALFGISCSLISQFSGRLAARLDAQTLRQLHLDTYLQWTPPGMSARAIVLADAGDIAPALLWLAFATALLPVMLIAWARILEHGITSVESATETPGRKARRAASTTAGRRGIRLLPEPVAAIAVKDARYFWRDPQIKASLLSSLFVLVIIVASRFYGPDSVGRGVPEAGPYGAAALGALQVFFAPLPALIIILNLSLNAFGLEREGLQMLLLAPVPPLQVFWGKNLAAGLLAFVTEIVLTVIVAALTQSWAYAPLAIAGGAAAILVMMGFGNVTSVLMPFRARRMRIGSGNFSSSEGGCLRSILTMVALFITMLALAPVAAAIAVPLVLQEPVWLAVALPGALLYGLLVHQVTTRLIASRFVRRAPEILAATLPES